ncbi:glutamine amidotransferase of anthranilate synthase [Thermodesulfatator indicus DSM 15286]|uniref:Glutamine amidotransferase of anthranilate synthase n=1 Tax=Thermodesulfatator indicus (strain DSM 15286 / JCM 11887 / CIR29812) TaxID=667014 RepID=F8ACT0_THEID|nr:aminodeoxychorismate/anthranilate synthase component II [Thermodesulfatator indicus]AEH44721.1 glutamine amidotransferase of anthranilate synthase [Thermodesulfatator indicus DSM 15286]
MAIRLVVIDNYDSFTYNLVQLLGIMCEKLAPGSEIKVFRNDETTVEAIKEQSPTHVVISPGPCTPAEAGISVSLIKELAGEVPVLGVCLGHQCIGAAFGGRIVRAKRLMHGKTSRIEHDEKGIFINLPQPFEAMRYHSLVIEEESLPEELYVTARDEEGEIMGVRHREFPIEGVQFHPESIGTSLYAWKRLRRPPKDWDFTSEELPEGVILLRNFLFPEDF